MDIGDSINSDNIPSSNRKSSDLTLMEEVKVKNEISKSENEILIKIEEEKDMRKVPKDKIFYIMISYVVMLTVSILKGSEHTESIISVEM